MRLWHRGFVCATCALALSFPANTFAQGGQQTAVREVQSVGVSPAERQSSIGTEDGTNRPSSSSSVEETASAELPDSPGAVQMQSASQQVTGSASSTQPSQQSSSQQPPTTQQPQTTDQSAPQQTPPQRPVGTAAAEAPSVTGITAAQPAGVAIAPAKQRRTRSLVLKVGAIVGAGVALGTTVALTMGTSSKPPGAH